MLPIYFLLHVPKTAGITVVEHLEENSAAGILWRPQSRLLMPPAAPTEPDRIRAVALGHYQGRSLERHFKNRELRRVVLLRDPVSLQLSYYNWRMMYFLSRGQGTYSFDLHLATLPRNYMTNFLLQRWLEIPRPLLAAIPDGKKLELVQRSLAQFWYVGAYTDTDKLIAMLAPELGVPPTALPRNTAGEWREFVTWKPLTQSQLSTAQRDSILADHALDQLLWEGWSGAGFNAGAVSPRTLPAFAKPSLSRQLLRPTHDVARLWHRGLPRSIQETAPRTGGAVRTGTEKKLLEALAAAPESRDAWRDLLTHYRRTRPRGTLPAGLAGTLETTHDPVLCLLKAETLLYGGRGAEARRFLRLAPFLSANRLQARQIVQRATVLDRDFRALVIRGDRARDRRNWRKGAELYRAALDLYPGHFGYRLQYANCLKWLQDYAGAEIQCRSARALGASLRDIGEELILVTRRLGYEEPVEGLAMRRLKPDSVTILDDPPTQADVELAGRVTGSAEINDAGTILTVLRRDLTICETIGRLIPAPTSAALVEAGKTFLTLYRAQAIETAIQSSQ